MTSSTELYQCTTDNTNARIVLCGHHALGVEERGGIIHESIDHGHCKYCAPVDAELGLMAERRLREIGLRNIENLTYHQPYVVFDSEGVFEVRPLTEQELSTVELNSDPDKLK